MSAPFRPIADTWLRIGLGAVALVVAGVPLALWGYMRSPLFTDQGEAVDQPIEFDHRHHVRDDGIGCEYCHHDAWRAGPAGVPGTDLCMNCHNQVWNDSPLTEPIRRSWFEGSPIVWNRVNNVPDFVYFDHRAHVTRGVGCETCHGRVDLMAKVEQHATMQMAWCIECHRDPAPYVRPPEHAAVMGYAPAAPQHVLGPQLVEALDLRPPLRCSGCHR
jgi:hypothetical protein